MHIGSVKTGGIPLMTLAVAGIAKPIMEGVLAATPVGNGTIISGAIKVIGAVGVNKIVGGGTLSNAIQIALAVDGIEDIYRGITGGNGLGGLLGNGGGDGDW